MSRLNNKLGLEIRVKYSNCENVKKFTSNFFPNEIFETTFD